jgi:hypothetical protein
VGDLEKTTVDAELKLHAGSLRRAMELRRSLGKPFVDAVGDVEGFLDEGSGKLPAAFQKWFEDPKRNRHGGRGTAAGGSRDVVSRLKTVQDKDKVLEVIKRRIFDVDVGNCQDVAPALWAGGVAPLLKDDAAQVPSGRGMHPGPCPGERLRARHRGDAFRRSAVLPAVHRQLRTGAGLRHVRSAAGRGHRGGSARRSGRERRGEGHRPVAEAPPRSGSTPGNPGAGDPEGDGVRRQRRRAPGRPRRAGPGRIRLVLAQMGAKASSKKIAALLRLEDLWPRYRALDALATRMLRIKWTRFEPS